LAALPSPPGEEREVADRVSLYLRELGLDVDEDDAGPKVGSTMGNLLCRLEPTNGGGGVPIFLCAHLDTVPPEGPIEPVLVDGIVTNQEQTILGADNKAAVAAMLDATRRVLEEGRPHAGLELVFTPKEEVGLQGAAAFDHTRLAARLGYVYDQAAPIGEVILGAPFSQSMEVRFHGRASHSGMYPEEGRSAIAAAARAIADLRLGRIDDETTANVGVIEGGTAGNIVPEWCTFNAEARSHDERKLADLVQEMLDAITFAAGVAECDAETTVQKSYRGYRFRRDDPAVRLAATALERSGFAPSYALSGGAADANVFNERGVPCVNLANGMAAIHTPDESIAVSDLEAMVEVTLALVDAARETEA
jgi:tripeptide aminopeptidase